jgi:hypothetical protein
MKLTDFERELNYIAENCTRSIVRFPSEDDYLCVHKAVIETAALSLRVATEAMESVCV